MWRRTRPDRSAAIVILVATICLVVDKSMTSGVIPEVPAWRFRYASARMLTWYVAIPAVTLAVLGYNPIAYLGLGRWRAVIRIFEA